MRTLLRATLAHGLEPAVVRSPPVQRGPPEIHSGKPSTRLPPAPPADIRRKRAFQPRSSRYPGAAPPWETQDRESGPHRSDPAPRPQIESAPLPPAKPGSQLSESPESMSRLHKRGAGRANP